MASSNTCPGCHTNLPSMARVVSDPPFKLPTTCNLHSKSRHEAVTLSPSSGFLGLEIRLLKLHTSGLFTLTLSTAFSASSTPATFIMTSASSRPRSRSLPSPTTLPFLLSLCRQSQPQQTLLQYVTLNPGLATAGTILALATMFLALLPLSCCEAVMVTDFTMYLSLLLVC